MQDGVRVVEHLTEQIELLTQDLERKTLGFVLSRQEAHHGHASALAVSMDAADPLLDALRIPG